MGKHATNVLLKEACTLDQAPTKATEANTQDKAWHAQAMPWPNTAQDILLYSILVSSYSKVRILCMWPELERC